MPVSDFEIIRCRQSIYGNAVWKADTLIAVKHPKMVNEMSLKDWITIPPVVGPAGVAPCRCRHPYRCYC